MKRIHLASLLLLLSLCAVVAAALMPADSDRSLRETPVSASELIKSQVEKSAPQSKQAAN